VRDWVDGIGGSEEWKKKGSGKKFFDNDVKGPTLPTITLEEMKNELGIQSYGDRKTIFQAIQDL